MDSQSALVHGEGNRIILDFPTLQAAFQLLQPCWGRAQRLQAAHNVHRGLSAAGLCLEIRVRGRTMACLGEGNKAGMMLRLLGAPT